MVYIACYLFGSVKYVSKVYKVNSGKVGKVGKVCEVKYLTLQLIRSSGYFKKK